MENLTKTQLIFLVILVSVVASAATAIITASLVSQSPAPVSQTINRIIEKTLPGAEKNLPEKETIIASREETIVKLVERVSPAVVSVVATKDLPVVEQYFINPFENDEFFRQFFPPGALPDFQVPQYRQKGTEKRQISSGTGFLVSREGLILTNKHVVEDTKADYSVLMNDGRKIAAKVLARDPLQDLAILKIEGTDFSYIPLGDSDNLKSGQTVIAIGNALGEFQNTISVGVISGLHRTIVASGSQAGPETLREVIQTDAAINPGNSGGPLLNLNGEAIGMNTAIAQGAENIGFTLPINLAKKDLRDLQNFGKIRYGFLGVRYVIVTPEIKEEKKLLVDYGALIIKGSKGEKAVYSGSPAEKIGLREGDIILEFGGAKINADTALAGLIIKKTVGEKVSLKVLRNGKETMLEAELAEMPEN